MTTNTNAAIVAAELALRTIAEYPAPEQDDMQAANMRKIARDAIAAQPSIPSRAPARWPTNAAEVREFLGSNCAALTYGNPYDGGTPSDDDRYELTAHDLLGAISWWTLDDEVVASPGAVVAEPALTGWQPIETGPKDGTRVLLLGSNQRHADGVWVQAAYAGNGAWIWPFVHANPIKWQPLPPAPKE